LQDFGEFSQSSQIGPHLVHPLSASPIAAAQKIKTTRRNIIHPARTARIIGGEVRHFQAGAKPETKDGFSVSMRQNDAGNIRQ
jgi:hypothetical protein